MAGGAVVVLFFFGFIVLMIVTRLAAGTMDRTRIEAHVRERGGQVQSIDWAPFGRGWWGEKGDRIYDVRFTDRRGRTRQASVKTSMFSGVYWTSDDADQVGADTPDGPTGGEGGATDADAAELQPLRAENERLRKQVRRKRT